MTNPIDIVGLQMKIIQDGIARAEEAVEGKDEEDKHYGSESDPDIDLLGGFTENEYRQM